MSDKEHAALEIIESVLPQARSPIVLCSFGKDSIVLLHLCLRIRKIPVMYWRSSKFHEKHKQAHKVSLLWDLEMYDTWPLMTFDYANEQYFEVLHVYGAGRDARGKLGILVMNTGVRPHDGESRFLCARDDLLGTPRLALSAWPWDVTFHGHKSLDPPEIGETAHITQPIATVGGTVTVCPLHDWSDADIWDYIKRHDVPYDSKRYDEGCKEESPDSYPTCWNCRDPKFRGQDVWCPKSEAMMPSEARTQSAMDADRNALLGYLEYCEVTGDPRTTPHLEHL